MEILLLKKALTYEDQVRRLVEKHSLDISDEKYAESILKKVNYYRLSAYGIGLKQKGDKEKYIDGVSIEMLHRLYSFDSQFKNILLHIIEQIEVQLRTQISNYLALTYGADALENSYNYEDKTNKDGKSVYEIMVGNLHKEITRQRSVPFVSHHIKHYGGHFPIWVAVELFTFGNLASLFDIMKLEDQKNVANHYGAKPHQLNSWILSLVEIRNICAHYGRLYNMPLKQQPFLYKEHRKYRTTHNNKVFPILLVIKRMLLSDERWHIFYLQFLKLMEQYADVVQLSFIGFPLDWEKVLSE